MSLLSRVSGGCAHGQVKCTACLLHWTNLSGYSLKKDPSGNRVMQSALQDDRGWKSDKGSLEDGPNTVEGGWDLREVEARELPWAVGHGKNHAVRLPLQPVLHTQLPVPHMTLGHASLLTRRVGADHSQFNFCPISSSGHTPCHFNPSAPTLVQNLGLCFTSLAGLA